MKHVAQRYTKFKCCDGGCISLVYDLADS